MAKIPIVYVTSSAFKKEENEVFHRVCTLGDGSLVSDVFDFDIRGVPIQEILAVDLGAMVKAEVKLAYSQLKVPCIVEHAGLIFEEYAPSSYPGGLTKPMWNTLGENFVRETKSEGRRATARAMIAYCDGLEVRTFVGETTGTIADCPRGDRKFYWDTVFIPDDPSHPARSKTYAEIVEDPALGLAYKIRELSQSSKAMKQFLEYRLQAGEPRLWRL